jgi:hypothetical protein
LLGHARKNGIFNLIDNDLVFERESTNQIKINHIKTMLCGNLIGIDKLERLKLLQSDPLLMDRDDLNEDILETNESLGYRYVIKRYFNYNGENNTKLQQVPPNITPYFDENEGKMIATWNPGLGNYPLNTPIQ